MSVPHGHTNERPTFTNEPPRFTKTQRGCTPNHAAEMSDDPQRAERAAEITEREEATAANERRLAAEQRAHARDERAKSEGHSPIAEPARRSGFSGGAGRPRPGP